MWRLLFILLFIPTLAQGANYYVSKSGSDSNGCTNATTDACLTIVYGLSKLSGGDTLYVRAGTYAEEITSQIPAGSSGNPTILTAYTDENVTIRPSAGANFVIMLDVGQDWIIIDRFELDGANVNYDVVKVYSDNVIIRNNNIHGQTNGMGVLGAHATAPTYWGRYLTVQNNAIHDGGGTDNHNNGIYISATDALIEGNNVYNMAGSGIQLYDADRADCCDNGIIRNNRVHNCSLGDTAEDGRGQGIVINNGDDVKVYNNQIYDFTYSLIGGGSQGSGAAIEVFYSGTGNKIYNNTMYNNRMPGIRVDVTTGAEIKNNLIYQNSLGTTDAEIVENGTSTTYANNFCTASIANCTLYGNPLFVSASDFRLSSNNSPAWNAGADTSATLTTDFASVTRVLPFDIGAYEYILPALGKRRTF